jgi:hypothetical protein
MLVIHFIILWMPAILHSTGESPARSIVAASMYSLGGLAGPFITAPFVDKVGIERVLSCALALGAFCVFAIGAFHLPFWLFFAVLCGAGIGGSCQGGIITVLPGLSNWDTRNRHKLGDGRGTYRQHCGAITGRSVARVQPSGAEHIRCHLHPRTLRSAVDDGPGAVAAPAGPHSMIRNSSKSGRDGGLTLCLLDGRLRCRR